MTPAGQRIQVYPPGTKDLQLEVHVPNKEALKELLEQRGKVFLLAALKPTLALGHETILLKPQATYFQVIRNEEQDSNAKDEAPPTPGQGLDTDDTSEPAAP